MLRSVACDPAVQSHFRLELARRDDGAAVIAVSGELDLASSPALEEELERPMTSDAGSVIVDLRRLEFIDSTGLSVLVRARQKAEQQGRRFALVKGPQQIQRLLNLTGVAERFILLDGPDEPLVDDP